MEKLKNLITQYQAKLKSQNRRSISRICNCSEGAFLLAMTLFVLQEVTSFTIWISVLCVLLIVRVLHVYLTIAQSNDLRLLYFAMIFCEVILSGFGFFYTPILVFILLILGILIGFPFIFDKFSLLSNKISD